MNNSIVLADYIIIGAVLIFGIVGALLGFGRCVKFLTNGIIGVIISVILCYFLLVIVLDFGIVKQNMLVFTNMLTSFNNALCDFLIAIRIEIIAGFIVLFLFVQILRKIIASLIEKLMQIDNKAIKIVNKFLGVLVSFAAFMVLSLVVMRIIWLSEGVRGVAWFGGSFLRLDYIYLNNPLASIIKV